MANLVQALSFRFFCYWVLDYALLPRASPKKRLKKTSLGVYLQWGVEGCSLASLNAGLAETSCQILQDAFQVWDYEELLCCFITLNREWGEPEKPCTNQQVRVAWVNVIVVQVLASCLTTELPLPLCSGILQQPLLSLWAAQIIRGRSPRRGAKFLLTTARAAVQLTSPKKTKKVLSPPDKRSSPTSRSWPQVRRPPTSLRLGFRV